MPPEKASWKRNTQKVDEEIAKEEGMKSVQFHLPILEAKPLLASQPESLEGIREEIRKTAPAGRLSEKNTQRKASNN